MTKITATIASAAAFVLAGNAFAQMPAAGEALFFQHEARLSVGSDSSAVRAPVSIQQVAVGEMSGVAPVSNDPNSPTRAEVRQETREAFAKGQRPAIGNRS